MIYAMLRIKNEGRWIRRVLESIDSLCERIVILDDHSEDDTAAICRSFDKVEILESPFKGLNETRDKNFLLEKIEKIASPSDYVLAIDGDEELAEDSRSEVGFIAMAGQADVYRFQVLYLWDGPDRVRIDGVYGNFRRGSMFRHVRGMRFASSNGGGFHCGNVPGLRPAADCDARLLHWGYAYRDDRLRKFRWYNAPDKQPIPAVEDGYRHMVIGDLLPPETITKWAGPLTTRAI
jgi:glycosyltransferase involved in cell wall biosynthesis